MLARRGALERNRMRGLHLERFTDDVVPCTSSGEGMRTRVPGARPALEQSFDLEAQQRFGDRKEAHAQLGGQLPPEMTLSKNDVAAQDALSDHGIALPMPDWIVQQTLSWVAPPSLPASTNQPAVVEHPGIANLT